MFRHNGKSRTLSHNLKIASLLSLVAGIENVAGLLSVRQLTRNVTGQFAFFVDELFNLNAWTAFIYFLYIFFFFFGSFTSNFLAELFSKKNDHFIYIIPMSIEFTLLMFMGIFGQDLLIHHANIVAFSLLFAMGLQNSLVTKISDATVRTTHLTGLFTDLGIELSQLLFRTGKKERKHLIGSVKLRFTIIGFFFLGGLISGIYYDTYQLRILFLAAIILIFGLIYDYLKFRVILLRRRWIQINKRKGRF